MNFTHASLFSGIGGFDLAAEWMGWDNLFHCEWNTFCQKVLAYHFPKSIPHHDITKTDFTIYRGRVDILTGGFPCQPFSTAGEQKGTEDERYLWPAMLRAIREIQPRYVVGENVPGLVNWNGGLVFNQVQADLETEGYEVTPFILPAASLDAPHGRARIWFIAYSDSFRQQQRKCKHEVQPGERGKHAFNNISQGVKIGINTNTIQQGLQSAEQKEFQRKKRNDQRRATAKLYKAQYWDEWPTQSPVCDGDDGLPAKLDGIAFRNWRSSSVKAGGNAIVPQVALQIFKAIEEFQKLSYI